MIVAPWKYDVIKFATAQLIEFQPRDDYLELFELTIIFLGATPPRGVHFRYPGALHRAHWMVRAIYAFTMRLKPGQATNIEADVIGKYLVRSLALRGTT